MSTGLSGLFFAKEGSWRGTAVPHGCYRLRLGPMNETKYLLAIAMHPLTAASTAKKVTTSMMCIVSKSGGPTCYPAAAIMCRNSV